MVWSYARRVINAPKRKSELIQVEGIKKSIGRPRITLVKNCLN